LQGVAVEQFAPIVNTVFEVRVTCRSPSWLIIVAGAPEAPLPLCSDQALVAVQP
jgi:hypothetical protein